MEVWVRGAENSIVNSGTEEWFRQCGLTAMSLASRMIGVWLMIFATWYPSIIGKPM